MVLLTMFCTRKQHLLHKPIQFRRFRNFCFPSKRNKKIDVEEVKQQTIQLYQQAEQLLDWLQSHPESQDNVRRFASYYLPTTLKLLKAYNDVEDQNSSVSDEVESNIVGFLHKINGAFQTLREKLLKHAAMDISAEISAMNVILNQDGMEYESPLLK